METHEWRQSLENRHSVLVFLCVLTIKNARIVQINLIISLTGRALLL
jgi:hypothetical protein